jgi:hypothetical protein
MTVSRHAVASPTALPRPLSGSPRPMVRYCGTVAASALLLALAACNTRGTSASSAAPTSGPTKTMLDAWGTMLCKTATANGIACADIYHAFNGPAGTKPAADLLGPDYTHPSQRGNDTIASVLEALGYTART